MNDEKCDGAAEPTELAEVPEQLKHLDQACELLSCAIKNVEVCCASVFSPVAVDGIAGDAERVALCPLAEQLRSHALEIKAASQRLDLLMARVQL